MEPYFDKEKVRKFFDILNRMGRVNEKKYIGRDKLNPDKEPCEKDVFIQRTVGKWFPSLILKILVEEGIWGSKVMLPIYKYISTAKPHFSYGHYDCVDVNYSTASDLGLHSFKFDYNYAMGFLAEEITLEQYNEIKNLFRPQEEDE